MAVDILDYPKDATELAVKRTELADRRTQMASRRTGMAFQITRMGADRTLMAVIRTALSLITFGFTIYQLFDKLRDRGLLLSSAPARHFGEALVGLGIGMLTLGILYHLQFMIGLRRSRAAMTKNRLIYGESSFPVSLTLVTATILLVIGIAAILSMVARIGPF